MTMLRQCPLGQRWHWDGTPHHSNPLSDPPNTTIDITLAGVLHALRRGKPEGRIRVHGEGLLWGHLARDRRLHGDRGTSVVAKVSPCLVPSVAPDRLRLIMSVYTSVTRPIQPLHAR